METDTHNSTPVVNVCSEKKQIKQKNGCECATFRLPAAPTAACVDLGDVELWERRARQRAAADENQ